MQPIEYLALHVMKFIPWIARLLAAAFFTLGLAAASPSDRVIEQAARTSYNFTTILEARVQISVENGIAALTGIAHDRDLRSLAADTVSGIPNIVGVNNRVIVDTSVHEYSDPWIAMKLRNSLLMRAGIDAARISAEVRDQVATLTGTVESAEQKELVETCVAALNWVRSVKNELVVDATALASPAANPAMDDASISALLKYRLKDERLLTLSRTRITTRGGVVLVTGHAESEAEKALISSSALGIRGVNSVQNTMLTKAVDPANLPYATQ
jgi:osmotically-inducible protein OsmY